MQVREFRFRRKETPSGNFTSDSAEAQRLLVEITMITSKLDSFASLAACSYCRHIVRINSFHWVQLQVFLDNLFMPEIVI